MFEDVLREADQRGAVSFGKECDRTDKSGLRAPQFIARFKHGAVTGNSAVFQIPRFLKRAQSAQSTGIVDRRDQRPRVPLVRR